MTQKAGVGGLGFLAGETAALEALVFVTELNREMGHCIPLDT